MYVANRKITESAGNAKTAGKCTNFPLKTAYRAIFLGGIRMSETKQLNIRADEDSIEKFRQFCEDNGVNQAQGFDHIIQVIELNKAKIAIPEREQEMESFEMHIKALMDAYLRSLEAASDTDARVKEQYKTELLANSKTIADYQKKTEELKEKVSNAQDETRKVMKQLSDADVQITQAIKDKNAVQSAYEASEKLSGMLQTKQAELEEKLKDFNEIKKSENDLLNKLAELRTSYEKAQTELTGIRSQASALESENKKLREAREVLEKENKELRERSETSARELVEVRKDGERALSDARKEEERALSDLQKDASLHEEKALTALREEYNEKIMKLREEKAVLQAQIEKQ